MGLREMYREGFVDRRRYAWPQHGIKADDATEAKAYRIGWSDAALGWPLDSTKVDALRATPTDSTGGTEG